MNSRLLALLAVILLFLPCNAKRYAGIDISMLPYYENDICAQYFDTEGRPVNDVVKWMAGEGINLMRVRLFVNPQDFPGGRDINVRQTLDFILPLCQRIKASGADLLLDFHYSDTWADPWKQWTPEAWKYLNDTDLANKVYDYTKDCLQTLRNNGVVPDMIQTGNEISHGMLWGPYGTAESDLKKADGDEKNANWQRLANLLKKAGDACREVCPGARIVLHTEMSLGQHNIWNFYNKMYDYGVNYDIIALSYYPYWHGDTNVLDSELTDLETYISDKEIWLSEFNHPYMEECEGDKEPGKSIYAKYPASYEGQAAMTQATIDLIKRHPNTTALIWWWGEFNKFNATNLHPEDEKIWSGHYHSTLFDKRSGRATPAFKTLADYSSVTVYFANMPQSFTNPGVYAWAKDNGGQEVDWPGYEVVLTDRYYKGRPVWKCTLPGDKHDYIILNNRYRDTDGYWKANNQTFDLNFEEDGGDGTIYWINDWRNDTDGDGNYKYQAWPQWADETTHGKLDDPCVYLAVPPATGWTAPAVSAWTNDGDNEVSGARMTLTDQTYDGYPVWKFTFSGSRHANLLFHDGANGWDESKRAATRPFVNGAMYVLSSQPNAWGNQFSAPYLINARFDNGDLPGEMYLFGYIDGVSDWDSAGEGRSRLRAARNAQNAFQFYVSSESEILFRLRAGNTEYGPAAGYADHGRHELQLPAFEIRTQAGSTGEFRLPAGSYTVTTQWMGESNGYLLNVGPRAIPTEPLDLYFMCDENNWTADDEFRLKPGENGKYTIEFPDGVPAGGFKISTGDWNDAYSSNSYTPYYDLKPNHLYLCEPEFRGGRNMNVDSRYCNLPATVEFDYVNQTIRVNVDWNLYNPYTSVPRRIYCHFGENRTITGGSAPKIHLYAETQIKDPSDFEASGSGYNVNTFDMKKVQVDDYDLWYYDLQDDQLWAKDATFFFYKEDGTMDKYTCGRHVSGDDFNWDFENWTRYIYYVDVADNNNKKASQSYITWDELAPVRSADKKALYIVGQGLQRLGPDNAGYSEWDRVISPEIYGSTDAAMNVFYISDMHSVRDQLTLSHIKNADGTTERTVEGTKFKMSWLRPYTYYEKSGKSANSGNGICQQRAWATFNLGIIGYSLTRANAAGLYPVSGVTSTNRDIHFEVSKTFPCNNFNQYDWFVPTNYLDAKYMLVVDIDNECNTVTLLPFEPNPTATAQSVNIETGEFASYDEATGVMYNSQLPTVSASVDNGTVKYRKYNIATAPVKIDAPHNSEIQGTQYTVEYSIYYNGRQTEVCTDNPGTVTLTGLPVNQSENTYSVGVRAKYTDNKTASRFTFHSKYSPTDLKVSGQLATPAIYQPSSDRKFYTVTDYSTSEEFSLGAYMDVPVSNVTGYAWYADFQATPAGWVEDNTHRSRGGELLHGSHPIISKMAYAQSRFAPLKDWTKHDDGNYFGEQHDWSRKLADNVNIYGWPVYLPEVNVFSREDNNRTTLINMKVTAVYPFLVDENPVRAQAGRQVEAAKRAGLLQGHNYHLEFLTTENSADITLDNRGVISGIDAVSSDAADSDIRYFNLQGVEVTGELTPGVYIRQQGTHAEKVIIR